MSLHSTMTTHYGTGAGAGRDESSSSSSIDKDSSGYDMEEEFERLLRKEYSFFSSLPVPGIFFVKFSQPRIRVFARHIFIKRFISRSLPSAFQFK